MSRSFRISTLATGFVILFTAFIVRPPDETLTRILSRFQEYTLNRPQEKLYLRTDKDIYLAGEDIWFSAYLTDASLHRADSISKTIYVDLFNSTKTLIAQRVLYASKGFSTGDLHLPNKLKQGQYILRGYTNYMKNTGEDFFFRKEISIVNANENENQKVPLTGPSIDLQFLPESGEMLMEAENQIAFKAVDQNGKGVDVSGDILDETGQVITSFKSEHLGMGLFRIIPRPEHNYVARIKNSNDLIGLPPALQKGYILRVIDLGTEIKITAFSNFKKFSSERCVISIVAQTRGIVCFAASGEILNTALSTKIPKSKFPTGITQITVFDKDGVPQCERLFYINHQDVLKISLDTDKKHYEKKKAVLIDLDVKNKNGQPANGNFSLSVVDASRISTQKFAGTLVNNLLLTSDLKGAVEDPGYYFQDTSQQTKRHLDLLMLTNGWRRFTWKTILQGIPDPLQYLPEKGIVVSGKILKALSKKPAPESALKIFTEQKDILILKTDNLGRFYTDELLISDSSQLMFQTDNAKGKQSDLQFVLNPFNQLTPLSYAHVVSETGPSDSVSYLATTKNNPFSVNGKTTLLKEVVVKSTRITEENTNNTFKLYGTADQTIKMKDIPSSGYQNILQVIQGRAVGVMVLGNNISIRGGGQPLFLLNGMQMDADVIANLISVNDVESIDILKGANAAIYGGRGGNGVIAIYTKKGYTYQAPSIGIHVVKYPGYNKAREFYSPNYDTKPQPSDTLDVRNTLYWNPSIKTDLNGKANIRFFTSDVSSHYKIIVEGISADGTPGSTSYDLEVE